MRAFIILGFLAATASASTLGYNNAAVSVSGDEIVATAAPAVIGNGASALIGAAGYGDNYQTYTSGLGNSGDALLSTGAPIVVSDNVVSTVSPILSSDSLINSASPILSSGSLINSASPILSSGSLINSASPILSSGSLINSASPILTSGSVINTASPILTSGGVLSTASPILSSGSLINSVSPILTSGSLINTVSPILSSGSLINTASPIITSNNAAVLSLNALNAVPQTVELNKQFFDFSAPEEEHDPGHISRQVSNVLKKNLQVVFIKAPENNAATNAALQIAKQAIEQKTAIYVLSKENDPAQVIGTLQQIQENVPTTPEVRIIKYRTQGDLAAARNTIQSQYENIGGSSQVINGGVAPVLDYASKTVLNENLLAGPSYVSTGSNLGSGLGVNYVSSSGAVPLIGGTTIVESSGIKGASYLPPSPLKK